MLGLKLVACIHTIHIVVVYIDCSWYRKLLLPLIAKYLPYCFFRLTICLTRSLSKPYYHWSIWETIVIKRTISLSFHVNWLIRLSSVGIAFIHPYGLDESFFFLSSTSSSKIPEFWWAIPEALTLTARNA